MMDHSRFRLQLPDCCAKPPDERQVIHCFYVVHSVLRKHQVVPRHKNSPFNSIEHALVQVRNGPILGQLYHFSTLDYFLELSIDILSASVVICSRVTIIAHNIHFEISRIPIWLRSAPHPDQVVELMVICKSVIHHVVKLNCCSVAFSSPPKPFSTCFVERPPQDRHFVALQLLQLHCNRVKISDGCVVLGGVLDDGFGHIKVGVICVEGASSKLSTEGREPMPEEYHNTFAFSFVQVPINGFGCGAIIIRLPVVPRIVGRVVLHVKAPDDRFETSFGDEIIIVKGGLS